MISTRWSFYHTSELFFFLLLNRDLLRVRGNHVHLLDDGARCGQNSNTDPSTHDLAQGVKSQHAARLAIGVEFQRQVAPRLGGRVREVKIAVRIILEDKEVVLLGKSEAMIHGLTSSQPGFPC